MTSSPVLNAILVLVGIVATLTFFSTVNLTQAQAVSAMFLALGVVMALWFWKQPWK